MLKISIPKPCHEDWDQMNPNEQGRHCNVCCKTVVDFTAMTDEAVKYFFTSRRKEESVCGRFKNEQLQRISITLPYDIYKISMPLWKQFLTACLLAFSSMLFSCDALVDNKTLGEPITELSGVIKEIPATTIDTPLKQTCSTIIGDSIYIEPVIKGETRVMPVENITPTEVSPPVEQIDTPKRILTGKVAFDTSRFFNIPPIDSVKTTKDSPDCDNDFIKL